MLKTLPPDLVEAQDLGISFFAGEAEDRRIDEVLRDGAAGALKPIYNHLANTPNLAGEPIPLLERDAVAKNSRLVSSFDLGRGCPFECSFCTIINVQGRKSRFRTPDDLERIVRANAKMGISRFFLTDDNFARNKHWEILADRLIALREEGLPVHLHIQVDTMAYKIPGFIEKLHKAGGCPSVHRSRKHQCRQSRRDEEAAEPRRGLPRDDPRLEEIPLRRHLRLYRRFPERH